MDKNVFPAGLIHPDHEGKDLRKRLYHFILAVASIRMGPQQII
jgi:hypothetical protein